MRFRRHALCLVLAAIPATISAIVLPAAPASAEPRIRIVDYGLFEVRRSGETVRADRTLTGRVTVVTKMKLIRRTDKILAQLGTNFGFRVDLLGFPPGTVTLKIRARHPKVTNPTTGVARAVSEYDWQVSGRQGIYFGYGIRKRWHINEGVWNVQILHDGKVLAQQKFELIVPMN